MMKKLFFLLLCSLALACKNDDTPQEPAIPEGDYINRTAEFDKLQGWKFRCKVYAESQTVKEHGGKEEFMKKMDKLLADASAYFCVPGINDAGGNQVHFFMTEMNEFDGQSKRFMQDAAAENDLACDLRIVVNDNAMESDISGGWQKAPYLAVGHDYDGLFGSEAVKYLAHNLGHSRGVPDLDAADISDAGNNLISGQTFTAAACMMNRTSGASTWSEYAKMIINASAGSRIAKQHSDFFPQGIKATVKTPEGTIATGALLKFYPVYPGSGKVSPTALYSGTMSVTGNFVFEKNPFVRPGQEDSGDNIVNYLVEVQYKSRSIFRWMTMYEVELAGAGKPYTFEIKLLEGEGSAMDIPDNDYINRTVEFSRLPGWKFRCKVYAETQTVQDYGGRIEFLKKMDQLMATSSTYFQIPGINDEGDNQVHFFMTEMEIFEGASRQFRYDANAVNELQYDLRVVVNGHAQSGDVSGGWLGSPYLSIGHDYAGLFAGYAIDAMVHEMGHTRGVPDLYAAEVPASGNPVNGVAFEAVNCIMNYPYGNRTWSQYAKMIINASAGSRLCLMHYTFFPKEFKATVKKADGTVAEGAKLKFYPIYAYSNKVEATPLYEGTVGSDGAYTFEQNPFVRPGQSNLDNNITNYLVEAEYAGQKLYEWMPMYEAELAGGTGNTTYTFEIRMKN